jgi:hypothetical protein
VAVRPRFPPRVIVEVKALACELPSTYKLPLSRLSVAEIAREAVKQGIVGQISGTTIWRWLQQDAIRPWHYRSWIFPRDPQFAEKAGVVLDLYHRFWRGKRLHDADYVLSTDEKTSIQARTRTHPCTPNGSHKSMRVEHEYQRKGAINYLAVWDTGRAKLSGRCEPSTGIEPFHRLVDQVMRKEPYRSAQRVFWIADGGSSHRGQVAATRMREWHKNAILINTPVHSSWLNQIEIYFSVLQRKALTPNDFDSVKALEQRVLDFQKRYEKIAKPFEWAFTRNDLNQLLRRLAGPPLCH